jgi:hypothetical protein
MCGWSWDYYTAGKSPVDRMPPSLYVGIIVGSEDTTWGGGIPPWS